MQREIVISKNKNKLAETAAEIFAAKAEDYIKSNGIFSVSLAGGGTPSQMHRLLSKRDLNWQNINIYFSDERYVAPTSATSNFYLAYQSLLKNIDIKNENIFPMPTLGVSAAESARLYEEIIKKKIKNMSLDAIFLGIGPDGHTASLFPNSKLLNSSENIMAINDSPKAPKTRISFTVKMLNKAKNVVFLASGKEKAKAVCEILKENKTLPAALVRPKQGMLYWLLDEDAASLL